MEIILDRSAAHKFHYSEPIRQEEEMKVSLSVKQGIVVAFDVLLLLLLLLLLLPLSLLFLPQRGSLGSRV